MKRFILILIGGIIATPVWGGGGDSVGNGGVIWSCQHGPGGQFFHTGILTDLFEAREQYGLALIPDPKGDPYKLYEVRKAWLERELPEMYAALKSRFEYVEQHITMVNAELLSTEDFNNAIKPLATECTNGEWVAKNIANFREEDQQIIINNQLWKHFSLPTIDKAALLFHEAVYYWMRTYFAATNSDKSRRITGILFSTLPTDKMKEEIKKVIGRYPSNQEGKFICVMKNSKRNQIYVAYENTLSEASLNVRLRCQDEPDPQWCERTSVECQDAVSASLVRCAAENSFSRKIYVAQGRSQIEAQFYAHMACYIGSQAQGAATQQCPDFTFMECE
jgi:hypothetical protein